LGKKKRKVKGERERKGGPGLRVLAARPTERRKGGDLFLGEERKSKNFRKETRGKKKAIGREQPRKSFKPA